MGPCSRSKIFLAQQTIPVDGQAVPLCMSAAELQDVILPLCCWLRAVTDASTSSSSDEARAVIGIIGPAAAGKSVLAQTLARTCEMLWGEQWALALSMDAYHMRNEDLESSTRGEHTLKQLKGHTFTLDAASLRSDLQKLRSQRDSVSLPIYDRNLHEPVPNGLVATRKHRLIILEGLHLLSDEPEWQPVQALLSRTIALSVPRSHSKRAVMQRKVTAGRTAADAEAHYHRVDGPIHSDLVSMCVCAPWRQAAT